MKRLLASDFDGTLFFAGASDNPGYAPEDVEAVIRFQKEGNLFGLNTGRPVALTDSMYPRADGVIPFDFLAGNTGAEITDSSRKPVYEKALPFSLILQVIGAAQSPNVCFATEEGYVTLKEGLFPGMKCLKSVSELENRKVLSFSFEEASPEKAAEVYERIVRSGLPVYAAQNWFSVDVCDPDCSKGKAMEKLSEIFDVPLSLCAAIGDGLNDLPAIQTAGTGFAMRNAPEEVKQAADYVVDSVAEAIGILESLDQRETGDD